MLLVVDIGNTNITLGVYQGSRLAGNFRMTTKENRTSDEYGVTIMAMLQARGVDKTQIKDVIISSVVPNIMYSFTNGIRKYFDKEPMIVGPGIKTGISIHTDNPREVGADRIVDAVGAYYEYGGPAMVIDFGTATTYDVVSGDGVFEVGITSPGIKISANALWEQAAKLPEIEIRKPESILAKNTVTSMQAGLVYGYIGQVEYIVRKVKEEMEREMKVIATGGLARIIVGETDAIDIYDVDLTFKGLRHIYLRNCK
ncbi:type III pantothenate kinase [Anaerotalea alkaliphila]|uniref:Type III pantothenate kinase n=1 Tax=Anaerotalea alkaliphila TaxID=2662126 RepID=A0A7X5HV43_9FIRM|nr:type III pantothenate kinase [Anaerotalea alkaliphila]NDL67208.1 type III pantothenate kinase [Anaerotalea alkaliphila]